LNAQTEGERPVSPGCPTSDFSAVHGDPTAGLAPTCPLGRWWFWLGCAGAFLAAFASVVGLSAGDAVYGQETEALREAATAQDLVNLLLVAPLTILLGWLATGGTVRAYPAGLQPARRGVVDGRELGEFVATDRLFSVMVSSASTPTPRVPRSSAVPWASAMLRAFDRSSNSTASLPEPCTRPEKYVIAAPYEEKPETGANRRPLT
jgi:hypothetical protein